MSTCKTSDLLINLMCSEALPSTGWHGFTTTHTNRGFETDLVIDAGSWWIPMPDSDSPWLMHTVSLRYQRVIIKEEVQIVGVELRYQERGSLEAICHMSCQGP